VQALSLTANIFAEAKDRGYTKMNLIDIGGGFPAPYDSSVKPFRELAKVINGEIDRLFPKDIQILAEPGRFLVATAGIAVSKVIGKAVRDGKPCYYINDGVYHTYSGVIFDHCKYPIKAFKKGGDAAQRRLRPHLRRARRRLDGGEPARRSSGTIWSTASTSAPTATPRPPTSTAFPPATVVHVNQ
jgi:ornithine decarboxylase